MKKTVLSTILIISAFLSIQLPSMAEEKPAVIASETEGESYKIAVRDNIDIIVYDEEDLSGIYEVKEDGTITYPLIGRIKIMGLTKKELEDRLIELLKDGYLVNPYVRVNIPKYGTRNIMVLGNVVKPGAYQLPEDGNPTILKAIADVGGFTPMANPNGTRIIRTLSGGKKTTINPRINDIMSGRKPDINLEPGDLIVVPERLF
jgi:polysaccharide export outer membrane protein